MFLARYTVLLLLIGLSQIEDGHGCSRRRRSGSTPSPPSKSLDWVKAVERTGSCGRKIDVTLTVQCKKAWTHRPSNDTVMTRLCGLIKSGITKYWSRTVLRGGYDWDVTVRVVEARSGDRKNIVIKTYRTEPWPRFLSRSHNSGILSMTIKYLQYIDNPDEDFEWTAAHEIGHSFLHKAKGLNYSWTHKGSSTFWQNNYNGTEDHPMDGEIDLMKYYKDDPPFDFYFRVMAAQEDVLLLLNLAVSTTKQSC